MTALQEEQVVAGSREDIESALKGKGIFPLSNEDVMQDAQQYQFQKEQAFSELEFRKFGVESWINATDLKCNLLSGLCIALMLLALACFVIFPVLKVLSLFGLNHFSWTTEILFMAGLFAALVVSMIIGEYFSNLKKTHLSGILCDLRTKVENGNFPVIWTDLSEGEYKLQDGVSEIPERIRSAAIAAATMFANSQIILKAALPDETRVDRLLNNEWWEKRIDPYIGIRVALENGRIEDIYIGRF